MRARPTGRGRAGAFAYPSERDVRVKRTSLDGESLGRASLIHRRCQRRRAPGQRHRPRALRGRMTLGNAPTPVTSSGKDGYRSATDRQTLRETRDLGRADVSQELERQVQLLGSAPGDAAAGRAERRRGTRRRPLRAGSASTMATKLRTVGSATSAAQPGATLSRLSSVGTAPRRPISSSGNPSTCRRTQSSAICDDSSFTHSRLPQS